MNVNINTQVNFKSKANPISPFVIKTKRGKVSVSELYERDLRRDDFMKNLTKFFCKNFASSTNDPNWKIFLSKSNVNYECALLDFIKYYAGRIAGKDEHMTLLLAKDKRNKIQGACLSYGLDCVPGAKENACYIDSIAVNPAYRGFSIGKILIEKTLNSAKNKFTDAFLTGDRHVKGFYSKLGFQAFDKNNPHQKIIMDYFEKRRSDYPEFVELYTMPLQETSKRWYEKSAESIISEM